jgi:hypothetical protein
MSRLLTLLMLPVQAIRERQRKKLRLAALTGTVDDKE